jgi:hypothetical protein
MTYKINPALHHFPAEAVIIGRIVVALGELEYMVALCASKALDNQDVILKMLYGIKSTSARIDAADTLMRAAFAALQLGTEQQLMMDAVRQCLGIRNQYAHCNWGDDATEGLFFTDLQDAAERDGWEHYWKHVDVPLLDQQEAFFVHAQSWLFYLENELAFRRDLIKGGSLRRNLFPIPTVVLPPPRHNPPAQHVPPWLDATQKARHIARAAAAEQAARPRERQPSLLRLTREEWAAKDAKDARLAGEAAEGHSGQ